MVTFEPRCGERIDSAANRAIQLAQSTKCTVSFNFNDTPCLAFTNDRVDEVVSRWRAMRDAAQKQSAQPAPAQSRDSLIEAVATELARFASDKPWDEWLAFDQKYIREQATAVVGCIRPDSVAVTQPAPTTRYEMIRQLAQAIADRRMRPIADALQDAIAYVDALHPELKPKPAPVEPVKTAGEIAAYSTIHCETINGWAVLVLQVGTDRVPLHEVAMEGDPRGWLTQQDRLRKARAIIASAVNAALAARDAAHGAELEALRAERDDWREAWVAVDKVNHKHLVAFSDLEEKCRKDIATAGRLRRRMAIPDAPENQAGDSLTAPKAEAQP